MNVRRVFDTFRGYRHPEFHIIQRRRRWAILSGTLITISILALIFRGLNYSIDFTGGSLIEYHMVKPVTSEQVRVLLAQDPYARGDAEVQIVGGDQVSIRTTALTDLSASERTQLFEDLAKQAGISPNDISAQVVGPTWGEQISRQALLGLVIVLLAITLYITLRFEWKMAVGAMVAMLHDVLITAGVYALTGREVSPPTVIAFLTILGFSLYDTVVIFDKVKENTESTALLGKDTYEGVANYSMNQVLMRSVNTSLVVILPILSLLLFGGATLKDFAFAMLIGVLTGAYSSIFVATPILVVLKEREPRYQQLRARLESRRGDRRLRAVPPPAQEIDEEEREAAPAAVAAGGGGSSSRSSSAARSGQGSSSRPRPKSKRRPPAKRRRR
jgi:preprotein translocase subunit SecF